MILSSFRFATRKGNLERVKNIYGYLAKIKHAAIQIRIRIGESDNSALPTKNYD